MYISKLKVENFKVIKNCTFNFNEHFNLIIGCNNSGKSTMMEALRLWQLAFSKFLKDRTNNQGSSFRASQYCSFTLEDIQFLRVNTFRGLFNNTSDKKFIITVYLTQDTKTVELPIFFTLTSEELNLRFELCTQEKRHHCADKLIELLGKTKGFSLKNTLLVTYVAPLFYLTANEVMYSKGYILQLLQQARSNEAIRNILNTFAPKKYQFKANQKTSKELIQIQKDLHYILTGDKTEEPNITFTSDFKPESDSFLKILAHTKTAKSSVELSLLGSGTLNIINILSVLAYGDYSKSELNVLLLDEPDSHLHADFQKRLFEVLKDNAKDNKQMFVITHNHELINAADKVLYIDNSKTEINEITKDDYYLIYKDLAPDFYQHILELSKIKKQIKKLTKPTLFCEGGTDVNILKHAFNILYNKSSFFDDEIDITDGNSCNGVVSNLSSPKNSSLLIIGLLDHDFATKKPYKSLIDSHGFTENHNILISKNKKQFCFKLPIPSFREEADWFENNTCIEYMFTNATLEKMGVPLIQLKGNTYKTIKKDEDHPNEAVPDSVKKIIQDNLSILEKNDFLPFKSVFEIIAEIIQYKLPDIC